MGRQLRGARRHGAFCRPPGGVWPPSWQLRGRRRDPSATEKQVKCREKSFLSFHVGLFHCCCSQWAREQRCARAAGTAGFLPKPWLLQPINRGKSHSPTLSRSLHPAACSCCYFPGRPWPSGHGKGAGDPQVDFPKVLRLCPLCQHRLAALGLSHLPFILGSTGQSPLPLLALGMLPKSQFTLNPPMGFSRRCPVGQVTPK